jgi:holin-like protein
MTVSEAAALQGAARVGSSPAAIAGAIAPAGKKIAGGTADSLPALKECVLLILELAALWGINKVGYALVALLHVPLPGNVAGLLLLFGLLCARIVPARWFERSSTLLARHLPFFFVPIAVGLMNLAGTVLSEGWQLLLVLVASAAVGLCTTGWVAQILSRLKEKR